ncbi:MAG: DUF1345 domain-containing protein [Sulfuriferula sp.]|nr:DUF1345 domain-containing protein [Sulfuriferula sp.]
MRNLSGSQRLLIDFLAGLCLFIVLPDSLPIETRIIASWDLSATVSILLSWLTMSGADASATRNSTLNNRQSSTSILTLVTLAALVSLLALTFLFKLNSHVSGIEKALHIALSIIALVTSWLLIHTRYTFHYAHRYYVSGGGKHTKILGGLNFPGSAQPDYFDFAYYAFVIGMTSQVSDVTITSRIMRRITLVHSLLSFAFNMGVLALSINIVASLI